MMYPFFFSPFFLFYYGVHRASLLLFWKSTAEVTVVMLMASQIVESRWSACLSQGLGFSFTQEEREREGKKSDFQAWRNKDTDELLWNYDLKTSKTYHGYKGAQSLPFRGKSQMFFVDPLLGKIPSVCCVQTNRQHYLTLTVRYLASSNATCRLAFKRP